MSRYEDDDQMLDRVMRTVIPRMVLSPNFNQFAGRPSKPATQQRTLRRRRAKARERQQKGRSEYVATV